MMGSEISTLKSVSRLFAGVKDDDKEFRYVYVRDGVANACDKKFAIRFEVDAPNGRYNINYKGEITPAQYDGTLGHTFPFDLEMIRPDFENIRPMCQLTPEDIAQFFPVLQEARNRNENIYIEKNGMGLKRTGEIYLDFKFNTPHIIELNPFYLHLSFTDMMRHPMIEMYQEIRPDEEEPKTPLVIGYGWKNCSVIMPIIDRNRRFYDNGRNTDGPHL